MDDAQKIVVTGLGVFTSNGRNTEQFTRNLFEGVSGVKEIPDLDTSEYRTSRAAVIAPEEIESAAAEEAELDRSTLLAVRSTREAVLDSGLQIEGALRYRTAVTVGSSQGGMQNYESILLRSLADGSPDLSDELDREILHLPPCRIATYLARVFDARGGSSTIVTACSAGSNAISVGADLIRRGHADVVLANGTEPFGILAFSGFNILMALSRTVSRPFDRHRDGLTIGEGAGTVVLESEKHAKERGARIYAELSGYGLSNDAYHATRPDPEAGGAFRAINRGLADAGVGPEVVSYINAHGTATRHNDEMELKAIERVYGERARRIPTSSIKSMVGHTLGAAGSIEAIATILALYHGQLPPTVNFETPEEGYEYDFVPTTRTDSAIRYACSHSFAFGGNAACLVFRTPEGHQPLPPKADTGSATHPSPAG